MIKLSSNLIPVFISSFKNRASCHGCLCNTLEGFFRNSREVEIDYSNWDAPGISKDTYVYYINIHCRWHFVGQTGYDRSELYVDAIDPGHNNHWVWESSLQTVPSTMFHSISSHQLNYCSATTAAVMKLVAVNCASSYLPLCQHTSHWD